jgi:L-seryl-tRNA(Ser) seleniumtransferase
MAMDSSKKPSADKKPSAKDLLKALPQVDRLLEHSALVPARETVSHSVLVAIVRDELAKRRQAILRGRISKSMTETQLANQCAARVSGLFTGAMRRVINATGVVLHTGLGRAMLPQQARDRLVDILTGATDLEFQLDSGKRGQRESRVCEMLCLLTGAEDALVCNNNAAAVSLMLSALCNRREVIVSRGQQVEIGGGFRIPDVIRRSGAKMVEVGATNRTHLTDYEDAITTRTGAIMRVHTSNYRVIGFTHEVELQEMAALAHEKNLLLLDDLGSGALVHFPGVQRPEPLVSSSLKAGADIVSFSGDKMLGASQAGIVLGRKEIVRKLAKHPMMRAFRCDKLTLAVLEAVLQIYMQQGDSPLDLPVYRMINEGRDPALKRGQTLLQELRDQAKAVELLGTDPSDSTTSPTSLTLSTGDCFHLVHSEGRTGSGALPEQDLPSAALALIPVRKSAARLHRALRMGHPAVVAAVREEKLMLDLKVIRDEDIETLATQVLEALR